MDALTIATLTAALVIAAPACADPVDRWRPLIADASLRTGVPAAWIEHVMRAESAGLTVWHGRPIVSRAGAMGLMQIMPATWVAMRARLPLGVDPFDPHDNILAGALYLRLMYDRFGYPGLFGAYNAGPARYGAYLSGERGLPGETRRYLASVADDHAVPIGLAAKPADGLFASRGFGSTMRPVSPMPSLFISSTTARMPPTD